MESPDRFAGENPNPVLRIRPGGAVMCANRAAQALVPDAEPTVDPEYRARWDAFLREAGAADARKEIELECAGRIFSFFVAPVAEAGYVNLYGRDVTESKKTEALLRLQGTAMETVANAIFITDREGRILWVNEAFTRLAGYTPEEALGNTPRILESGKHDLAFSAHLWSTVLRGEVWRGDIVNRHKDGRLYTVCQTVTPMRDDTGEVSYLIAVHEDITARKEAEEHVRRLAQRDMLTNLPNRSLFHERLGESMDRADRVGKGIALLFLDLDDFKDINDTLGHSMGDNLLVAVASRLKEKVRRADTLARIGGDEFAVVLHDLQNGHEAVPLAQRLLGALSQPFHLDGHTLTIGASIGITVYPRDSESVETLLRNADLAMYRAKAEGRSTFRFFSQEMDVAVQERVALARDLRRALETDELWMAYQPQVDLKTGEVIGAEALLRWTHPTRGLVSAGEFVPVAEETGLMAPIGEWVLAEVCRQSRAWREAGLPPLCIAVNISGMQFSHQDVPAMVAAELARNGLPPHAIEVEITESVLMGRSANVVAALDALRDAGVSLSLDDFGTGYSSLKYLREFPVSRLKIDQSFIRGIGEHESDEAIVCAVIGLGHNLHLKVMAEGVEKIEQASFLWRHGCDEAQGYFFAKPLSTHDFAAFVKGYKPPVELVRGRSSAAAPTGSATLHQAPPATSISRAQH
jgi:diguanylate cyclase (GGDEF)-like protein/PAS domain S-box-containing protein